MAATVSTWWLWPSCVLACNLPVALKRPVTTSCTGLRLCSADTGHRAQPLAPRHVAKEKRGSPAGGTGYIGLLKAFLTASCSSDGSAILKPKEFIRLPKTILKIGSDAPAHQSSSTTARWASNVKQLATGMGQPCGIRGNASCGLTMQGRKASMKQLPS